MNCPACGAALERVANTGHFRCAYCGSLYFPEVNEDGVALLDEKTPWNCPVCAVGLQGAALDDESIAYCDKCRGFLANHPTFGRIVNKRRAGRPPTETPTEPFNPNDLRRRIDCPSCGGVMDAHPYGGGGNAVVDTCLRCNVIWLDAEELSIIGRYVPYVPRREPPTLLERSIAAEETETNLLEIW